jgi:hypothetical protein
MLNVTTRSGWTVGFATHEGRGEAAGDAPSEPLFDDPADGDVPLPAGALRDGDGVGPSTIEVGDALPDGITGRAASRPGPLLIR